MFQSLFVAASGKRSEKKIASAATRIIAFAALALSGFAATAAAQRDSSSITCSLKAFRTSGRLSVTSNTAPRMAVLTALYS